MTVQQISDVTHVPKPYLSKMMQNLARTGMLQSRRGLGGGFLLSRSPDEITVLDIINSVEPIKHDNTCTSDIGDHGALCPLHRCLNDAADLMAHKSDNDQSESHQKYLGPALAASGPGPQDQIPDIGQYHNSAENADQTDVQTHVSV